MKIQTYKIPEIVFWIKFIIFIQIFRKLNLKQKLCCILNSKPWDKKEDKKFSEFCILLVNNMLNYTDKYKNWSLLIHLYLSVLILNIEYMYIYISMVDRKKRAKCIFRLFWDNDTKLCTYDQAIMWQNIGQKY